MFSIFINRGGKYVRYAYIYALHFTLSVSVCLSVCLSVSKVNMVFDIEFIFCFELFARALDVKNNNKTVLY